MSKIRFHRRPMPLIADYRPLYKIFQILAILHYTSRGGRSSLIRLHLINWVLKSEDRKKKLLALNDDSNIPFRVWGIDPALNIALQYGVAQGLIEQQSDAYSINENGKGILLKAKDENIQFEEVEYLSKLGKRVTEKLVSRVVEKWS